MDTNTEFCRTLLRLTHQEVKIFRPREPPRCLGLPLGP
jgi:hypothetical protein